MISTKGLLPADVLAALYNASHVQGMGFLQARPGDMTREQAAELLEGKQTLPDYPGMGPSKKFDYLYGRVMKVNLENPDQFEERGYDRDLGQGAAARVVAKLYEQQELKKKALA